MMARVTNFTIDEAKLKNLRLFVGKYKLSGTAYIEDNKQMHKLLEANIYVDFYEMF